MTSADVHRQLPRSDRTRSAPRYLMHALRPIARWLLRRRYTVRVHDASKAPADGGVIFASNHVGVIDGPMLAIFAPRPVHALTKQEMFRGPLGWLLPRLGGIPLDRSNPGAVVRRLVAQARTGEPFLLILAAEGTRTKGEYWKSGFWRIARSTGLPISLAFIDGPSKTSGFGPTFKPTKDVVADMDLVREFYADKCGIHPERRTEPRLREELTAGEAS